MTKIGLVLFCILLGVLLKRLRVFPENAAHVLNRFVIYVSLPALTLFYIHALELKSLEGISIFYPIAMPWLLFGVAVFFFAALGKMFRWDRQTIGALTLTAGLGNTSFVGFALLESLHGSAAMPIAVLLDQAGTFLAMATVGITTAVYYSGRDLSVIFILKKVFSFPPFLALVTAALLRPFPFPDYVSANLERLGSTLVPLALTAVGMELKISGADLRRKYALLCAGLGFKMLLAPLFFCFVFGVILGLHGFAYKIIILEAAMAPMITAGILATEYDLRPRLAALMLGIGVPLSLITVVVWNYFL